MNHQPIRASAIADRLAAYRAALAFMDALEPEPNISRLSRSLRTADGRLLRTLDEAVRAIETGDWPGVSK